MGLCRLLILGFVDAVVFWVCESSWVSVVFFFFFSNGGGWDGHGFAGLRWKCEFVGQIGGYGWLVFFSGGGGWDGYGFTTLRWSSLLG